MNKLTVSETIDLVKALQLLEKLGMSISDALSKIGMFEDKEFKDSLRESLEEFNKFQEADFEDRAKILGIKLVYLPKTWLTGGKK